MRIIKSKSYMKKEAIFSLPGDSNLPPGVRQRDIDEQGAGPEEDIVKGRTGEVVVNNGATALYYTYSYDYSVGEASNIEILEVNSHTTKDPIIKADLLERYFDEIRSDIKVAEEDEKMQRYPDNIPF